MLRALGKTSMTKRSISAYNIVQDIRAGFTDSELQEKYRVRPEALPYLMRRLVDEGLMTDLEMYERRSLSESDLMRAFTGADEAILKCPVCGNPMPEESVACARCESLAREFTDTLIIGPDGESSNISTMQRPIRLEASTVRRSNSSILASQEERFSPETQYVPTDPFSVPPNPPAPLDVETNIVSDIKSAKDSNKRALLKAASRGLLESVKDLLDLGLDVNSRSKYGNTPLMRAAYKGHVDIANLLLETKADVNAENGVGNTALIFAIDTGHAEIVELLLKHGANASCKTIDGNTPLLFACVSENPSMVAVLVGFGADVNQGNSAGDTPLLKACDGGRAQMVEVLLQAGAAVNVGNKHGNTALMKAAFRGHESVVRLLLRAGAHVNVQNVYGNTALMKTCHRGHVEIAKLLLEAGADANASDRDGITALMRAQKTGRQDLIELLVRYLDRPLVQSRGK